ncbi:helix-turn-helix domain-containing protein [Streptomyces sp. NPDC102283]|uniref:helix-turn-helix domain-containing protein n=1 Tax=Streptomyces sp. NPDC102283 TaxID=3366155 RepID=UPI0037F31F26
MPGEAALLTEQLRLLRRRHGMTLATLAHRTSYSKSSWGRYLSGKALPPRQAVREFAQAISVKPDRLLLLLEIAERGQSQPEPKTPEGAGSEVPPVAAQDPRTGPEPEPVPSAEASAAPETESPGARPPEPRTTPAPASAPEPRRRRRWGRRWGLIVGVATGVGMATGLLAGMLIGAPASQGEPKPRGSSAKCTGFECRNKDAQGMECHIGVWTAAAEKVDEVHLELRYSPRCGAAWARITEGRVGDTARVEGQHDHSAARAITYDRDTYSPMVEAPYPAAARACVVIKDGGKEVCTAHGGASPLPAAVTDERKP